MLPPKKLPSLLPAPPRAEGSLPPPVAADKATITPKRKRKLVSQACNTCRNRKIKCDGGRPHCASCIRGGLECQYDPSKIEVQKQDASYRSVVGLLREGSQADSAQVLQRIRDANHLDSTVTSLAEARLLLQAIPASSTVKDVSEQTLRHSMSPEPKRRHLKSPYDDSDFMFEKEFMTDVRDQYIDKQVFVDLPELNMPLSRWTEVSDDDRIMNHLLRMFWTWDNIVEKALYRPIFEEDVSTMDPLLADVNSRSFCSRFLVNALLALSCLYTMDSTTFRHPGDPATRGRRWADEAEALLAAIGVDKPSIPQLQGLLALFCYEGNLGSGTKAMGYYLRAMDVYKALNEPDTAQRHTGLDEARSQRERLAMSWCMWGFYCCEWRGSQALGFRKLARRPSFSKVWREPDFPLSLPDSSGHWWYRYPMSFQVQPSMKVEIREVDAILSDIVEEALDFIYPEESSAPPSANPQRALELYKAIVRWKQSCPDRLRLEDAVLPSAILLHVSAEVMITAILRPFAHMSKAQFGAFDPKERCYAHASSLASAIWTFRSFSVIRFEYWLTHALGTAGYIAVGGTEDDPNQTDILLRACQCLYEMRSTLPLATDILCGIHAALKLQEKLIPAFVGRYFDKIKHRKDGLLHYTVAALMPTAMDATQGDDMYLQELLNGLDHLGID